MYLVINEQFEWNFPNLKILKFHEVQFENCKSFERSFLQLTQVKFHKGLVTTDTMANFLSMNPQIENLLFFDVTSINFDTVKKFIKYVQRVGSATYSLQVI